MLVHYYPVSPIFKTENSNLIFMYFLKKAVLVHFGPQILYHNFFFTCGSTYNQNRNYSTIYLKQKFPKGTLFSPILKPVIYFKSPRNTYKQIHILNKYLYNTKQCVMNRCISNKIVVAECKQVEAS